MSTKVLIVGAGIAGLSAARDLAAHGMSSVILEARERIGGRIFTLGRAYGSRLTELPVELGAEFVHGNPPRTMRLIREFGLEVYEVPDRHAFLKGNEFREMPDFWERIDPALKAKTHGKDRRKDRPFQEALCRVRGLSRADKNLATTFVEGFHAADTEEISQKALSEESSQAEEIGGDRAFRLLNGYGQLVDSIYREIPTRFHELLLETSVREIRWDEGYVEVLAGSDSRLQKITGDALIMTAPPGPLREIQFSPELDRKKSALEYLRSGAVIKVVVRFREAFWEKERGRRDFSFVHSNQKHPSEKYFTTWWSALPFRSPVLTGWTGGPAARELSRLGPDEQKDAAVQALARIFKRRKSSIEREMEAIYSHNWQSDPFSQGAYGYISVGGIDAPKILAEPVKGTLFFAGEITETGGLGGTVESAIQSGKRAALQVLNRRSAVFRSAA